MTSAVSAPAGTRGPALTGTVVVTGASGFVGSALLRALEHTSARTIALVRRPARVPAARVLAGPLDAPWAIDALEAADQVVHLAGALRPDTSYWDANVETAAAVARAVRRGVTRQIVLLSYIGASVTARNEYLRSKAEAERILAATGRDLVVVRAAHIIGAPDAPGAMAEALRARPDGTVLVPGDGLQPVAPVFVGDVVAAIAAALAGGGPGASPGSGPEPGTYDLPGPDTMTLNELVALVNRGRARIRHVPERLARLAALFIPSLPAALVDVMLRPCVGDSSRAAESFGIAMRSLRELWS